MCIIYLLRNLGHVVFIGKSTLLNDCINLVCKKESYTIQITFIGACRRKNVSEETVEREVPDILKALSRKCKVSHFKILA